MFASSRTDPATGRKRAMTRWAVWRRIKALLRAAELNDLYNVHTLRHTFVALEVEAQERLGEVDPFLVARRSRHRSRSSDHPHLTLKNPAARKNARVTSRTATVAGRLRRPPTHAERPLRTSSPSASIGMKSAPNRA